MNPLKKKELDTRISDIVCDIAQVLEEERCYPSVREAGSAPTEGAIETVEDYVRDVIFWVAENIENLTKEDYDNDMSFEEVLEYITDIDKDEELEECGVLERVDDFVRDNGERKYVYDNIVYKHLTSGRFLAVEIQNDPKYEWPGNFVQVQETELTEKVIKEWS